jgi:hypothetical protein
MNEDRVDEDLPEQVKGEQHKQSGETLEPDMAITVRIFIHDKKMICGVETDHAKEGFEEKLERTALQISSALAFGINHFKAEIKALLNADQ